ncbi:deoxycytidylate deaminase [Agrilus planipennis]|uniref:Probable deoxycytidylate deaminase n=1 Tax=Agrilus planipennis TaxID=224129 RepID=A0A1W4X1H6_AGRPL|nr:deoxycytidylate deaminase [Agrilus planipennis]
MFNYLSQYFKLFVFQMAVLKPENQSLKKSGKREDYLSWDEYFMATAILAAKRSKDPSTQVGACIVNDKKQIVGVGYNGMPRGCSDDEFPWGKGNADELKNKYYYVCHAEMNAILNKNSAGVENCRMYVALFPCNECAKFIIQSGIREIVYMSDKDHDKNRTIASKRMLDAAGVKYWPFTPQHKTIDIDFSKIDWNHMSQC